MPCIATIQDPLGNVDPSSSKVCLVVHIGDSVNRTAVNSHPQLDLRMILQSPANLQRASGRLFRAVKEKERHSVSRRHSIEFAFGFPSSKTLGISDDLIELVGQS